MYPVSPANPRVSGLLACAVLLLGGCAAVGETEPGIGTWKLHDRDALTPQSTTLQLEVTRLECSSGVTGKVLAPQARFHDDRILLSTHVEPLAAGAYGCQGNKPVPLTVVLPEPVGTRMIIDAACLGGPAAGTEACADGGIRWRP
ncbi:hypothetical protein ACSYDW_02210 [Paeniglutamicibacter sp. R2-26]|uniref:hypothetical protein n=1 Tax=Paeniglutamicibacter sp. R2-26 TaxID=3144417 RepID=UPI003EE73E65